MSWVRVLLKFILAVQLSLPCALFAEPRNDFRTFTPNPESLVGIPNEYFKNEDGKGLPELPPELAAKIAEQLDNANSVMIKVFQEALFLNHGLYKKMNGFVDTNGIEALKDRIAEKKDKSAIVFDQPTGRAQPMAIGNTSEDQRVITGIRVNGLSDGTKLSKGYYFLIVDRSQFDPEFLEEKNFPAADQKSYDEELRLRKSLSGIVRMIASRMLFNGENIAYDTPIDAENISESEQREIQAKIKNEIGPMSNRYRHVMATLKNPQLDAADRRRLESERDLLENELVKKSNDKTNALSRIVETAVANLGPQEYKADGYHVVVIMHNHGTSIESVQRKSRPATMSLEYWREYWSAIYEPPHIRYDLLKEKSIVKKLQFFAKGDLALTEGSSGGQFLMVGFLGIAAWAGLTDAHMGAVVAATLVWGIGYGVYSKTMINWSQKMGDDFSRFLKATGTGVGYGLTQFSFEGLMGGSVGWQRHASLWATQILKGPVKTGTQEIPRFLTKTGDGLGNLKIKGFDTEIRMDTFYTQLVQLALFGPKLAAIFLPPEIGIPVYMMAGPIGKLVLLKLVEDYANEYEAEHGKDKPTAQKYRRTADRVRAEWEDVRLLDKVRILTTIDNVGRRIEHWADLIEQKGVALNGAILGRLRVRVHQYVGTAVRWSGAGVRWGGEASEPLVNKMDEILSHTIILDFVVSRFPGYYAVPSSRYIFGYDGKPLEGESLTEDKRTEADREWARMNIVQKTKRASAIAAYKTYVYANSLRTPAAATPSRIRYCRALR